MMTTTKRPASTLMIPDARLAQLRMLAGDKGTIVDTIEQLLNGAIEAGRLPDELPGFPITLEGGLVRLGIGAEFTGPTMNGADANDVAATLEAAAGASVRTLIMLTGGNGTVEISRAGRAVAITSANLDAKVSARATLTPRMALDLARQLRAAARRIQRS